MTDHTTEEKPNAIYSLESAATMLGISVDRLMSEILYKCSVRAVVVRQGGKRTPLQIQGVRGHAGLAHHRVDDAGRVFSEFKGERIGNLLIESDELMRLLNEWNQPTGTLDRFLISDSSTVLGVFQNPTPAPANAPAPEPRNSAGTPRSTRSDLLTHPIRMARSECKDPNDSCAVWLALCQLAQMRRKPFLGVEEGDIRWEDDRGEVKFFTRKNLRDRLRRSRQ